MAVPTNASLYLHVYILHKVNIYLPCLQSTLGPTPGVRVRLGAVGQSNPLDESHISLRQLCVAIIANQSTDGTRTGPTRSHAHCGDGCQYRGPASGSHALEVAHSYTHVQRSWHFAGSKRLCSASLPCPHSR